MMSLNPCVQDIMVMNWSLFLKISSIRACQIGSDFEVLL